MVGASEFAGRISEAEIRRLVVRFYERARRDEMLGPVFTRVIGESEAAWNTHFDHLQDFWSAIMLTSGRYHRDPFSAHLRVPGIAPEMFDRWLALFGETAGELFEPEIAEAFRLRSQRIARSLRMGLFERIPARKPAAASA